MSTSVRERPRSSCHVGKKSAPSGAAPALPAAAAKPLPALRIRVSLDLGGHRDVVAFGPMFMTVEQREAVRRPARLPRRLAPPSSEH